MNMKIHIYNNSADALILNSSLNNTRVCAIQAMRILYILRTNTGEACNWFYNSQSSVNEAIFARHADATAFGGDDVIFHGSGGEVKVCCTHSDDTKQMVSYQIIEKNLYMYF